MFGTWVRDVLRSEAGPASQGLLAPEERRQWRVALTAVALITSALWSAWLGTAEYVRIELARWWAVASLLIAGFDFGLATLALKAAGSSMALRAACLLLDVSLAIGWLHATGSASSYTQALMPLLIAGYRLAAGARAGMACCCLVMLGQVLVGALEATGALAYAPLYQRDAVEALRPSFAPAALLFALLIDLVALALSSALAARMASGDSRQTGPSRLRPPPDRAGRHIGRVLDDKYRVVRLVGRGGMGEVYAAKRLRDERDVAIKILHSHLTDVPNVLDRFWRETETAAQLPGERIAQVLDRSSRPGGPHYVVMELLRGEDLSSCLRRRRRLPLLQVVEIVEQIASVLEAAAALGIVHRDVKPRNIYLVSAGKPGVDARLLDFGICRLQDAAMGLTRTAVLLGTPGYLAPEQVADGFGEVGPQTDVFALGAVIYRALTGENAFPSRQPAVAVYEALNHNPLPARELAPDLSEDVEFVLAVALAKNPAQRYARASELARDLRAAATGALDPRIGERAKMLLAQVGRHDSTLTSTP
jgi:hypothetical protein